MKKLCEKADLYFQGLLTQEEETRFQEHLMDCPACAHRLEALRGLNKAFQQEERRLGWRRVGRFVRRSSWLRVAALVGLVSTLGIGYYTMTRPETTDLQPGRVPEQVWSVDTFSMEQPVVDTLKRDSVRQMPAASVR